MEGNVIALMTISLSEKPRLRMTNLRFADVTLARFSYPTTGFVIAETSVEMRNVKLALISKSTNPRSSHVQTVASFSVFEESVSALAMALGGGIPLLPLTFQMLSPSLRKVSALEVHVRLIKF